ncbi:MAG: sigma-70 family RNA polymerase sigma factor [Candidatus Micrarchaeota archaeon]
MLENEGLVFAFANKFWKKNKRAIQSKYGFGDVVQQGRLALRRAVVGFDEARGFRFSTFAVNIIKREFSSLLRKREMRETSLSRFRGDALADKPDTIAFERLRPHIRAELARIVDSLSIQGRAKEIFLLRTGLKDGHPRTLEGVGRRFKMSKENVRLYQEIVFSLLRERPDVQKLYDLIEHGKKKPKGRYQPLR